MFRQREESNIIQRKYILKYKPFYCIWMALLHTYRAWAKAEILNNSKFVFSKKHLKKLFKKSNFGF